MTLLGIINRVILIDCLIIYNYLSNAFQHKMVLFGTHETVIFSNCRSIRLYVVLLSDIYCIVIAEPFCVTLCILHVKDNS